VNRDLQVILISPGAHYPAHDWPVTVTLMRALRQKGVNVRAVTFSTTTEPVPPDLKGSVTLAFSRLPPGWKRVAAGKWQEQRFRAPMHLGETLTCLLKALKLTRGQPRAVLHFVGGSKWLVVLVALWFKRVRFVYWLYDTMLSGRSHGPKAWVRPCLKKLLQRAVATGRLEFTCENEFIHEKVALLVGSHVHVTAPSVIDDTEVLPSREEARRRLDLPAAEKILLFFGTHRREKDYRAPLKGCLLLPEPPLVLFIGKVISSNDPRQVIKECGYPKARVVEDFVSEDTKKDYFAAADAVVLPYEADFSRGSGVLIECYRYLRPMIASATPYFSAFLRRYSCGVIYAPGDSASFAEAAARLLSGADAFGPALEKARHDHSATVLADQYIKLYQQ
jgi:glycosyltransferase involved in cell wall biosynthesis